MIQHLHQRLLIVLPQLEELQQTSSIVDVGLKNLK